MGKAAIKNPYLDTLGGGERYTISFASVLAQKGYDVDIEWKDKFILEKLSRRFGVKLGENIKVVSDIKSGSGYEVCFWVSDGSIPMFKARRNFLHFQVPFRNVNGSSLINKMKFFRVEKIICNSEFTKKVIDQEYGVRSIVIYPPVDTAFFKPKRKEHIILYVGRFSQLTQTKNQHILIDAFKKLVKTEDFSDYKLILAGGVEVGVDDYLEKLKKSAKGYNIEFMQSPNYKELVDLYGRAKYFWSAAGYGVDENKDPQRMEHFGITVVEAMAAGTIPIVYNGGGHKEIIKDHVNGFLWNKPAELIKITKDYKINDVKINIADLKPFSLESFSSGWNKLL